MKNITLSIDEDLLKAGREYAKKHRVSLNSLIRRLLRQTVSQSNNRWLDELFRNIDTVGANSKGKKWKREDLYRV
jgi:hypothetical protein